MNGNTSALPLARTPDPAAPSPQLPEAAAQAVADGSIPSSLRRYWEPTRQCISPSEVSVFDVTKNGLACSRSRNEFWNECVDSFGSLTTALPEYGFNRSYKGKHTCSYGLSVCAGLGFARSRRHAFS